MPHETDSILLVDSNTVLPATVALQSLQVVAARSGQIAELSSGVQRFQFPTCSALDVPQCWYLLLFKKSFCAGIAKAPDHKPLLTRYAVTVKQ